MDRNPHRRQNARLFLGIEAEFICMEGRQAVILQDISATGAKIEASRHRPTQNGILRWMTYEVLAQVKWRDGKLCGIIFDRPISNACLIATRAAAPGVLAEQRRDANSHARTFATGRSD